MAHVSSYLHRCCRLLRCRCALDGREAPYWPRALSFSAANEPPNPLGGLVVGGCKSVHKYVNNPAKYWDQFYRRHDNKFFKDRHYLEKDWGRYFSVDEMNEKDGTFSEPKVVLESNGAFICERVNAFVYDVTMDSLCKEIARSSVDIVTLIFMLSAVSPDKMPMVLQNIKDVLKPGGCVLFRDYAVKDFAQAMDSCCILLLRHS